MATTSLNLVYYASVAKGTMIVAEHINAVYDIASVALDFLEKLPPLHSRFTYTTSRRIFTSLMDGSFTYCAIVDEALGKANAFTFLERVRDEFKQLLRSRGCGLDGQGLEAHSLVAAFAPAYRHLVKPLVGVPQKEMDPMEEEVEEMLAEHNEYGDGYNSQDHTFLQRNNINEASDHSKNPARLSEPPSEPLTKKTAKPDKRGLRDQVSSILSTIPNGFLFSLGLGFPILHGCWLFGQIQNILFLIVYNHLSILFQVDENHKHCEILSVSYPKEGT
jgi:hypothetical protein